MTHQMPIVFLLLAAILAGIGGFIASATQWARARAFRRRSVVVCNRHHQPWRTIWPWSTLFFALMTLVIALVLSGCQTTCS